jgi:RHS repeat-associated protein
MRALKKGRYGTVQYVSDNYTVRNKDLISKHVFAGNTRLVSKTVMREEKSGKMTATEQGAYYYHPDHLGSSNVVTDKDGRFYEQIEYFPYGETWINNKATAEQTSSPYKFTAKEQDPETGLYYYGARYYDAKLSRWCSADDRFDGLYSSQGQDVFAYVGGNPVRYVDPDGKEKDTTETIVYKNGDTYSVDLNKCITEKGDSLTKLAEKQLVRERGTNKFSEKDVIDKREVIKGLNNLKGNTIPEGRELILGFSNHYVVEDAGADGSTLDNLIFLAVAGGIIRGGQAVGEGGLLLKDILASQTSIELMIKLGGTASAMRYGMNKQTLEYLSKLPGPLYAALLEYAPSVNRFAIGMMDSYTPGTPPDVKNMNTKSGLGGWTFMELIKEVMGD